MSKEKLRRALNGYNEKISLMGIPVYNDWMVGQEYDILGNRLDKKQWIIDNISEEDKYEAISFMLVDWYLYENGWFIASYKNKHLYKYLCQIGNWGNHRPEELEYFIKK